MRHYNPTTPGRRGMTTIMRRSLALRSDPQRSLVKGKKKRGGRNNAGRITTRHQGGGHKQRYRTVDLKGNKIGVPGTIVSHEYDPNRTALIALIAYRDGEKRYVLLPQSAHVGEEIITSETAPLRPGNRLPVSHIPVGTRVYNVELHPGGGGRIARCAGGAAEVLAHDGGTSLVRLPSKEIRKIPGRCWASIGMLANEEHMYITVGKAGRTRWMGVRPTVRGSAMNPVDHPYGGGEGRALRGTRRPKNKWGKGVRGVKTRKKKKYSNTVIIQRRKK